MWPISDKRDRASRTALAHASSCENAPSLVLSAASPPKHVVRGCDPRLEKQTSMTADRFKGSLLGLALGDAMGAPFEGGLAERLLWRLIGTTRQGELRWTDDTQMAIDVAESLVVHGAV